MDIELVNLTNHDICIWGNNGSMITVRPSGKVARLRTVNDMAKPIGEIRVVHTTAYSVTGLPKKKPGYIYLVSSTVAKWAMRPDVLCPDTTSRGVIKDGNGDVVAVKQLQSFCDSVAW